MIIWGEHDPLIPVAHAYSAHERIRDSRLEIFADAGHFPYRDNPRRFVEVLFDFIQSTAPAQADEQTVAGAAARRRSAIIVVTVVVTVTGGFEVCAEWNES